MLRLLLLISTFWAVLILVDYSSTKAHSTKVSPQLSRKLDLYKIWPNWRLNKYSRIGNTRFRGHYIPTLRLLRCVWTHLASRVVLGRFRQNRVRAIPILLASVERNRNRFGIESGSGEPQISIKWFFVKGLVTRMRFHVRYAAHRT
jgi:hypothetical protein